MAISCLRCSTSLPFRAGSCPSCGTPTPLPWSDSGPAGRSPLGEEFLERLRLVTAGEFEIIREIGHGGMARVYLAHELSLDRQVALKALSPLFSDYPEIVRRFQHEARMAGQLSHPHIVPVFAVYQGEGICFFTMPFVGRCSLRDVLREAGRLRLGQTLEYVEQAASGLAYAHAHGVVHRDVKPENMLLEDSSGRVVLTDFGLAKALGGEPLTLPGDVVGTPHYMAPEQCDGHRTLDGRCDQYTLGLVAYEMLTGEYPFRAVSLRELLAKQIQEEPTPLDEIRPGLPERVTRAIHRALAKDPALRYPSMPAFAAALLGRAEIAVNVSPAARPARSTQTLWMRDRLATRHRRRRWRFWMGRAAYMASAFLLFYLALTAVLRGGPPGQARPANGGAVEMTSPADAVPFLAAGTAGGWPAAPGDNGTNGGAVGAPVELRDTAPGSGARRVGVEAVLESYRRALEARDTVALARLHSASVPRAEREVLEALFRDASELQVGLRVAGERTDRDGKTVEVDFPIRYLSGQDGHPKDYTLALRLRLMSHRGGWRIVAGELR